jgi:uncharacterized protein (DUF58 family)
MSLTQRGWSVAVLAGALLGLGGWSHYPGLVALGAALAGLLLLDVLAVAPAGGLRAQRTVEPLQVPRHDPCTATLTIVHRGLPAVVDGVEPVGARRVSIPPRWLRPGSPVKVTYDVPSDRRGLHRVGPARLRRLGPLGLARRQATVGGEVTVRVVPRVLPVRGVPAGARRGQVRGDERVALGGTDLVGLHEYVPGDDLRRLHWATSARTGTLMVRDDADPSQAELTVLLDDRGSSYVDPGGFEEAVDVAAALTAAASGAGHPVRLRTLSGAVDVGQPGSSAGSGRAAPELLAALADTELAPAGAAVTLDAPLELDVVALISGAAAEPAGLALEAGRGVVGVVLVVDPGPVPSSPGMGSSGTGSRAAGGGPAEVRATGAVTVLRGSRAEVLLSTWDSVVAGGQAARGSGGL